MLPKMDVREERFGSAADDTVVLIIFASQNANWLATSAASVSRALLLTTAVMATTTRDPTKLPSCIGAQSARQRKSGRSFTALKRRASQ